MLNKICINRRQESGCYKLKNAISDFILPIRVFEFGIAFLPNGYKNPLMTLSFKVIPKYSESFQLRSARIGLLYIVLDGNSYT